jgi:hypothetical protein
MILEKVEKANKHKAMFRCARVQNWDVGCTIWQLMLTVEPGAETTWSQVRPDTVEPMGVLILEKDTWDRSLLF